MNIYFNVLTETLGKVYSLLISRLYKPEKKSRQKVLKKVSYKLLENVPFE